MPWIEQHGPGYRVAWRDQAGRKQHTPHSYPTTQEAEAKKQEITRQLARKALLQRADASQTPIRETARAWLASLPIADITRASYERSILKPFLQHFAGRSVSTITRQDLSAYFAARRGQVQVSTLGRDFSILRSFLECATEEYLLPTNPAKHIRIPRVHKSPGLCLSFEQESRLLAAVTDRQRAKILLARDAGLRAANLGQIRRADVDPTYKTITFHVLKKRVRTLAEAETRTLPLTERLTEALEQFQHTDSQAHLFTYNGMPLADPDKFLKRLRPRLGFHFRWHDLRHTFYTRLLEACDNYALTEWSVGHAITYWHPTPEKLREAFRKMEEQQKAAFQTAELEQILNPKRQTY
jgi:integrase